jgi:hypothetical protein
MSMLKFECPSCNQNLECDRACSGDIIHCPRCCAQIRIPFESVGQVEGSVVHADLIAPPPNQAAQPQPEVKKENPAAPKEVICPVCRSELRVPVEKLPAGGLPTAELLHKTETRTPPQPATAAKVAPPKSDQGQLSIEERERQIAAAREAHPVQANTPLKPRLDFVLSEQAGKSDGPPLPDRGHSPPPNQEEDSSKSLSE